ncbi:hypothetical protein AAF712_012812 [Marasmius tenuissimus]|uniref:Uncharacterized protein n=1 Tax=Marasmius tenuissimus TaxID=585030 RepID=A0ABR2ZGN3_9AGAR
MSSFIPHAHKLTFVDNQQFQHVAEYITNIHQCRCERCEAEDSRLMPRQSRFREIYEGDILQKGPVWSK